MGFWSWFLGTKPFEKVIISRHVLEASREFAQQTHPKEFTALLQGEIEQGILYVHELVYQPFSNDQRSAWMRINLPFNAGVLGTIHSHPSSNRTPSRADLRFFNKLGYVHLILGYPYGEDDFQAYDKYGKPLKVSVRTLKKNEIS